MDCRLNDAKTGKTKQNVAQFGKVTELNQDASYGDITGLA
jgi:hypothetical protein